MKLAALVALAVLAGAVQAQTVYRWVDANGRIQYTTEKPPAGAQATTVQGRVSSVGGNAAPAARPVVAKAPVKMYATDWCPYCRKAREFFASRGIAYTELDIEKSQAAMAEYRAIGGRGVPVILVGDARMNGFSEPRLAEMLKAAGY